MKMNPAKQISFLALVVGAVSGFLFISMIGELYVGFVPEILYTRFTALLLTVTAFTVAGFVAALIARGNELLNSFLLGAIFFMLTISTYYWPGSSDTLGALLQAAVTKFVSCTFGGFLRICYVKARKGRQAA